MDELLDLIIKIFSDSRHQSACMLPYFQVLDTYLFIVWFTIFKLLKGRQRKLVLTKAQCPHHKWVRVALTGRVISGIRLQESVNVEKVSEWLQELDFRVIYKSQCPRWSNLLYYFAFW